MRINNLSTKNPICLKEIDIWGMFLRLLNANNGKNELNDKDIKVFAAVLAEQVHISYFSKPNIDTILNKVEKLTYSEAMRIKDKLVQMGLIVVENHHSDKRKKSFLPAKSIQNLQVKIKSDKFVTFMYPIKLDNAKD